MLPSVILRELHRIVLDGQTALPRTLERSVGQAFRKQFGPAISWRVQPEPSARREGADLPAVTGLFDWLHAAKHEPASRDMTACVLMVLQRRPLDMTERLRELESVAIAAINRLHLYPYAYLNWWLSGEAEHCRPESRYEVLDAVWHHSLREAGAPNAFNHHFLFTSPSSRRHCLNRLSTWRNAPTSMLIVRLLVSPRRRLA